MFEARGCGTSFEAAWAVPVFACLCINGPLGPPPRWLKAVMRYYYTIVQTWLTDLTCFHFHWTRWVSVGDWLLCDWWEGLVDKKWVSVTWWESRDGIVNSVCVTTRGSVDNVRFDLLHLCVCKMWSVWGARGSSDSVTSIPVMCWIGGRVW